MSWWSLYLAGGAAILAMMTLLWVLSVAVRDASLVDIFWGPGFSLPALVYFALGDGDFGRRVLITTLVMIWGLRLGLHLYRRNRGKGEDYRYRAWRRQYGAAYWWVSFFQVYLLQGALMWLISAPLLAAQLGPAPALNWLDGLGALVWVVGFLFEAVGDGQLARFKADPANAGRVMDRGLWRYTRHPNYFGDACLWWGYWLIAGSAPWGWATAFAPALMTFLLVRVSGVALLEQNLAERPGYREYVQRTSAFFPWPPKRDGH